MEDIFKILNALFYPRKEKSYEVLKNYVDFSGALTQEVKKMSGLGESVYNEDRQDEKMEIVINMYKKNIPMNQISEIVKLSIEKVEEIIQSQEVLV